MALILSKEHKVESKEAIVLKYWCADFVERSKTFVLLFVLIRCSLLLKHYAAVQKEYRLMRIIVLTILAAGISLAQPPPPPSQG